MTKYNKNIIESTILFILTLCCIILPVNAIFLSGSFRLGDSSVPVDEDDFIQYDFETASTLTTVNVSIENIYQFFDVLVINISVSKLNSNTNKYEILIMDSIEFENQELLSYNKTMQFFQYHQHMENLLIGGYGGYYAIPNDPVDVNIIKGFIESQTPYSATVQGNTITIEINNVQAILTYNEKGILIREEIKVNNQTISTLKIVENAIPSGNIILIFVLVSIVSLIIIQRKKISLSE
ncbi:MAG: hypothetical protein ACFE85_02015 [Candidatus Hodarchaeota archaeon]